MDVKQDLFFNHTDIMAASMAPTSAATGTSAAALSKAYTMSTFATSSTTTTAAAAAASAVLPSSAANNVYNHFHELCRSCGKTNSEIYDLFQATTTNTSSTTSTASPFNTSSTTCYPHLNSSTSTNNNNNNTNIQPSSINCTKSSASCSSNATFDSVAATAKATAKGQSNMENILQEMQIWHLQIKCNDGLPQRICAKCTAQFYMIHKFRRKCLKVQTHLRGLYEQELHQEQQQLQLVNERHEQQIVPTSTLPPTTSAASIATITKTSDLKVPPVLNIFNDLINDNYGEQPVLSEKSSSALLSVNFETNTWNANNATLLDNVVNTQKTMAKTEAYQAKPLAVAVKEQLQRDLALWSKDKKQTPPPMVLNSEMPLLKKHKEQICDNYVDSKQKSIDGIDEEEFLAAHVIFKSTNSDNKLDELIQSKTDENNKHQNQHSMAIDCHIQKESLNNSLDIIHANSKAEQKRAMEETLKLSYINKTQEKMEHSKESTAYTEGLFITKAALKAYTISQTKTPSAYDNSQSPSTSSSSPSSASSYENQDSQLASANFKQTTTMKTFANKTILKPSLFKTSVQEIQQVSATVNKMENDDNNNDHNKDHHHNNDHLNHHHHHLIHHQYRQHKEDLTEDDDNTCTSTNSRVSSPTSPSSSSSNSSTMSLSVKLKRKLLKTEVRFKNSPKRRSFAKRLRRRSGQANNKRAHRYKLNAKSLTPRRRALKHTTTSRSSSTKQRSQHELKRLQDIRTCSSSTASKTTSVKHRKQLNVGRYRWKNNIATKSTYERIKTHIPTNGKQTNEKEEKLETPALIMEDESSASSSSSLQSSTRIATKSISSSATTPAVTDLVKPLKENHETNNAYCTTNANAIKREHFISGSSRQQQENDGATCYATSKNLPSTTTSTTCTTTMWKTKAAMKANANDMHMDMDVPKQQQKTNDTKLKLTLQPYNTAATTQSATSSTTTTTTTALCSKTLIENQSINSSNSASKTVLSSSKDHKVKDINTKSQLNNLWPEEADQKQIKHNINEEDSGPKEMTEEEKGKEDNKKAAKEKSEAMEFINNPLATTQKTELVKSTTTTDTIVTTALTPPAKQGCMKLIIQRKRGARFECRRKDDLPKQQKDAKRRKFSKSKVKEKKLEMESLFSLDLNGDYSKADKEMIENPLRELDDITNDSDLLENIKDKSKITTTATEKATTNKDDVENNKENPLAKRRLNEKDFALSKHNTKKYKQDLEDFSESEYRDSNSYENENFDEEEDEELELANTFHLNYNMNKNFELKSCKKLDQVGKPKKLIIRVPLTSLTQEFKRLHLTLDQDGKAQEDGQNQQTKSTSLDNKSTTNEIDKSSSPSTSNSTLSMAELELNKLDLSVSTQSDLLGFSQSSNSTSNNTPEGSSQKSIEFIRSTDINLCTPSSKINDFINDFQNNCIDSSEMDETSQILPQLPTSSQELSDEIRDVEDTLNGILSEMHDKDIMYATPRSGEHDDFFAHSVYSPLTDAPTTPSQSFYAESPCTINSNPMSVSPFIQPNMDYNAMTPQSNHSGMGHNSHMNNYGAFGCTNGSANMFGEQFPPYNDCFAEESTQSELIAFQNDIPCFENIEITNPETPSALLTTQEQDAITEEEALRIETLKSHKTDMQTGQEPGPEQYVDLCDDYQQTTTESIETSSPELVANIPSPESQITNLTQYTPNTYQNNQSATMQTSNNDLPPQSNYIVANSNQGPILIANPNVKTGNDHIDAAFKAHGNNLQIVTLGQALEANKTLQQPNAHIINNPTSELNWSTTHQANRNTNAFAQQPVIAPTNSGGTTTYYINAGGEVYRASIPTPSVQNSTVNTLIVPPPPANTQQPQPHTVAFNKTTIDANENYFQTQHRQQLQQQQQHQTNPQTSQYIMVVNNMGTTPQYYATPANLTQPTATTTTTAALGTPTVLFHQAAPVQNTPQNVTNQCNFINNSTQQLQPTRTPEPRRPTPSNTPLLSPVPLPKISDHAKNQTMHQKNNQQLQFQIKQRQYQLLQPRSPNRPQQINLICRFCHKRPKFTNNVDYSNHIINMHPAEKPYNCPYCPMHFIRRFERQQHVAQVHGSRYKCAQCGLSFCAQRTLDFHLQRYHANLGRSHQHQHAVATSSTSSSSSIQQQQNSTSLSSSSTYQLLQHNQQQRLVRVEDVHVQVTGESKNKRSIDLQLDGTDTNASQSINEVEPLSATSETQEQARKLCCPDCDGDNDDCCASNTHHDHNNQPISQQQEQQHQQEEYTGNESVNNQHITIPSPEQTEPDSTTTLRHFRKRQLCEMSPFSYSYSFQSSSSSSSSSSCMYNNSHDNVAADSGDGGGGGEQIVVERALRDSHNCLFCEESFTNEIALRKHHHLAHGTQVTMPFVCTVCKRGFRMRTALQRHMETHDAEGRPYECNICQVRFPRPSQLTLHKLTVHKFEKPHSCEECGKQFGTESAMKAHAKLHEEDAAATTTELSSCMLMDTTTTTESPTSNNEQNINIQSSTSGELATTTTIADASSNLDNAAFDISQNNHNNNNHIVSGLTT